MSGYGLTPSGFVIKTREEIVEELGNDFIVAFGTSFDVNPESPDGQVIGIVADAIYEAWLRSERSYNNFIPSQAFGVGLDSLVELNGIARIEDEPTYVSLTLTGTDGTLIPEGSIVETADGLQFTTDADAIIPVGLDITVKGICTQLGAISVGANELTTIVTEVVGWDTVNNPEPAITGIVKETDAQLRARRFSNTISRGTSSADAIYEAVSDLNLTFIAIQENDTGVALGNGQPPHSIHVVAEGGTQTEIAQRIFDNKSEGITAWGGITEVISDSKGYPHNIGLDRPTDVVIEINVTVQRLDGSSNDSLQDVENVLLTYVNDLQIGEDVHWSRLFAPVFVVPNVTITLLEIKKTGGGAFGQDTIEISTTEKAIADGDSITITEA